MMLWSGTSTNYYSNSIGLSVSSGTFSPFIFPETTQIVSLKAKAKQAKKERKKEYEHKEIRGKIQ